MKTIDHRTEKRYPFHWKVAIVFDGAEDKETYHGVTLDLSMNGCAVLTDHNIFSDRPVTILISLPVDAPKARRQIVEAKARMVYTVLSSGHQQFRCGIQFLNFKGNSRAMLKKSITARAFLDV